MAIVYHRLPVPCCTWCGHPPHDDTCPTVTDKDPCPCVKRATRDAMGDPEPQEEQ